MIKGPTLWNFIPALIKHPTSKTVHKQCALGEFDFFLDFEALAPSELSAACYTVSRLGKEEECIGDNTCLYLSVRTDVVVGGGKKR